MVITCNGILVLPSSGEEMSIRVSNPGHSLVAHILHSTVEQRWLAIDGGHIARLGRDEGWLLGAVSITSNIIENCSDLNRIEGAFVISLVLTWN